MLNLTVSQQLKHWMFILWMGAALFVFAACGTIQNDVTMSLDEQWSASLRITISEQELQYVGGKEALDMRLEQTLQQRQAIADTLGARLSRSKQEGSDGSVTYVLDAQGQGFDSLNRLIFDGAAEIRKTKTPDETRLVFGYSPIMSGGSFYSLTLNVHGGKIEASNADRVNGTTLSWANLMQTGVAQVEIIQPVAHPSIEYRLTIFQDEIWKVETRLTVAADEYTAIGDAATVRQQIEELQQPILSQAKALNLSTQQDDKRSDDGSAIYIFTARGQGLTSLNQYVFKGDARIEIVPGTPEQYVHFDYALSDDSMRDASLQIRGGTVITANTSDMNDGLAKWHNLAVGSTVQADVSFANIVPNIADHINLLGSEQWKAETQWIVIAEEYTAIGDEAEVDRMIQPLQQSLLARIQTSGVTVEQRKERDANGAAIYVIATTGKGLDVLNQVIFENKAKIQKVTNPNESIHFEYSPAERASVGYSLQLKAGEILRSNADGVQQGLATWSDLGETDSVQADITEPGNPLGLALVIVAGLIALAVGGFLLLRRRRNTPVANPTGVG